MTREKDASLDQCSMPDGNRHRFHSNPSLSVFFCMELGDLIRLRKTLALTTSAALTIQLFGCDSALGSAYTQYGRQCLISHEYAKAEQYYRAELSSNNRNAEAHFGLSQALFCQGKRAEAIRELQEVVDIDRNGPFGFRARASLEKLKEQTRTVSRNSINQQPAPSRVTTSPSSPPSTKREADTYQVRLSNGEIFCPCISPYVTPNDLGLLRIMEQDRNARIADCIREHQKWMKERNAIRDAVEPGSQAWKDLQYIIDDGAKIQLQGLICVDVDYMRKCQTLNRQADQNWLSAHKGKATVSKTDALSAELAQRRLDLESEFASKVEEVKGRVDREHKQLNASLAAALGQNPSDALKHELTPERDRKWDFGLVREADEMCAIAQDYCRSISAVQESSGTLASQKSRKKDDDAKFMPAGRTNVFSRSYETYGDESGYKIPLIAEPQKLLVPNKR